MMPLFVWLASHLGWLTLMGLVAFGLGALVLRRVGFDSGVERTVFCLVTGFGIAGVLLFVVGVLGGLYRVPLIVATVAGASITAWRILVRWTTVSPFHWVASRVPTAVTLAIALPYCGLLLLATQFPPQHWDATMCHLVLAREYLDSHTVRPHLGLTFPVVPALNHMLFTWAMALKDDVVAQMVEFSFALLTAAGLYAWGRRMKRPAVGLAAAAIWLGHPLVLWLAESAYVDVGEASIAFLAIYALSVFCTGRDRAWWLVAMTLFGMAAAVKSTGTVLLAAGGLVGTYVVVRYGCRDRESGPRRTWDVMLAVAVSAAMATPFWAFIAATTGNPLWPALRDFGSESIWTAAAERYWRTWASAGLEKTIPNFFRVPFELILAPSKFFPDNNRWLLPLIAVWPVAWAAALFDRSVRWWTGWALGFTAVWFLSSQQVRLWLPALPIAGLALSEAVALGLARLPRPGRWPQLVFVSVVAISLGIGSLTLAREVLGKGVIPPTSAASRHRYLTRRLPAYPAAHFINQAAQPGDRVYVLNTSWINYYLEPDVLDWCAVLCARPLPEVQWPADRAWLTYIEGVDVNWILMGRPAAPVDVPALPERPAEQGFWPDFPLVYADRTTWVFHRVPAAKQPIGP